MTVTAPFQQMFLTATQVSVIFDLVLRLRNGSALTLRDGSELVLR